MLPRATDSEMPRPLHDFLSIGIPSINQIKSSIAMGVVEQHGVFFEGAQTLDERWIPRGEEKNSNNSTQV